LHELLHDPLATIKELQERVNARLRKDLTPANIKIPCHHIMGVIRKQMDRGKAHYQEKYLLEEMMSSMSCGAGREAGIQMLEAQDKRKMKKVFQSSDKRIVIRHSRKLKEEEPMIEEWVEQTESNLLKLLLSVGSAIIPRTTNAIERFFRAFSRFYKVRCGFFSLISARRELVFFLLCMCLFDSPRVAKLPLNPSCLKSQECPRVRGGSSMTHWEP